jgi:hypothetical protein
VHCTLHWCTHSIHAVRGLRGSLHHPRASHRLAWLGLLSMASASMKRHKKECGRGQVLLELVYESNVRFCGFSGVGRRRADFFMSPAYAAGMVFVSSIMDRLTCQLFYNKVSTAPVAGTLLCWSIVVLSPLM